MFNLDQAIRRVQNFPKEGILFYDITSLVANPDAMDYIKSELYKLYKDSAITKIVAVESRGFLFAPMLAEQLRVPVVLARKKGKLPNETVKEEYELEYGTDSIEMQKVDLEGNDNYLLVDDLIATGGTIKAVCNLIENNSAGKVAGVFSVIGLPFLKYQETLGALEVKTLVNYDSE